MDMGPAGVYQLFGLAGSDKQSSIGGIMTKMRRRRARTGCTTSPVDAIDAAVERGSPAPAADRQRADGGPRGERIVNAVDPQYAMFALVAPNAPASG